MVIPRFGRISRSLLKASLSRFEVKQDGRSVLLESAVKARASVSFGEFGQSAVCTDRPCREGFQRNLFGELGQSADWTDPSCTVGLQSNSAGAGAILGHGDQRNCSHGWFGGSFWRSLAVFPSPRANKIGLSRKFSTTRPLDGGGSALKVKSLDHVVLTVKDIEATCKFYSGVLGMEVVRFGASDGGTRVALAFGGQKINLHQLGKEFEPKAHRATAGSADLCFITDTPLDVMQKHIESSGVSILQGPVGRTGALGAIRSVYFRDPDLNLIEVSNYV